MAERDGYIPGVPCWVDTGQPDPETALAFYSGVFGWEFEDVMPTGSPGRYFIARIRGGDVGAIGSLPERAPAAATWNTYICVADADETASRAREAGGTTLVEPFDMTDAGRTAVLADPEGAAFSIWQPGRHKGAQIVNEHGSVNFNGLHTRDVEAAKRFYGAVFGWGTITVGGAELWTLPGYGDHIEERDPGLRARIAEFGAEPGFEDVVANIQPIGDDEADVPAHWSVTFSIDDADKLAARATELGGTVLVPPMDVPWARMTVIADPQGASFIATRFAPENR
jgi:predicted enzyme related to lactoylglutathione lyase